jgi:type I restriction enzyme R subunit
LNDVRELLPANIDYGNWRRVSSIELEDRCALVYGLLTDTDEKRDEYLQAELRLTSSFLLVKHLDDCRKFADEVIFYQRVRKQLLKTTTTRRKTQEEIERAIRDLVDDSVASTGVVDIFKAAGIQKPDISILDDDFLQTFKDKPHQNLRLKLLAKLMHDEIVLRQSRNLTTAKSFRALLEEMLRKYHNRLIDAAAVIQAMIQMRKDWASSDKRAAELGLEEEELAFYDAVATNYATVYGNEYLSGLIHDVVQTIKRNLKVDWTEAHRDDVMAGIRAAVKRVLRQRDVKAEDLEPLTKAVLEQAAALYADWPVAA